jgi:hypothetical protein
MMEPRQRQRAALPSWRRGVRADRKARRQDAGQGPALDVEGPRVDIAPNDPALAYFQSNPEPTDLGTLKLDSPGIRALRDAGVKLVVPLVTQGELIALIVGVLAQARKRQVAVLVYGLSEHYQHIFEITRLADFMQFFPEEEAAVVGSQPAM